MLFLPELTVLGAGLILFFFSLGKPGARTIGNLATWLAAATVAATLLSLQSTGELFFAVYRIDLFSQLSKLFIALGTLAVLLFSANGNGIKEDSRPEYFLFLFMAVLGLMMLVSSVELLAIFISLELSSFAVYIMVPLRQHTTTAGLHLEAGMKYLLFGVVATGLMLFGMSYLFGLSGTTSLAAIAPQLPELFRQPAAVVAIALILLGFFYKLALFPLHFWVPDVYQGAANETTAFIATVPKLAAVALLIRLVGLVDAHGDMLVNALMVCAVLSMFYGNLSALAQTDIKRILGFSGISHAGFVLVGLLTFESIGYATSLYYIIGYLAMNLACFLVICTVAQPGKNLEVADFTGMHQRAPLLALALTVGLFALAGIPPFVGFTGKLLLLLEALRQGHLWLVVLAAINTAIAIYYYLSIVRVTFCSDPEGRGTITASRQVNILAVLLIVVIVVMGVMPRAFLQLTTAMVETIL
jgi:NADH-quinone oxidoreductase subunit N